MSPEQITRNQHFIAELRANQYKAKNTMRDSKGGRCCLCVALDTAIKDGFVCNSQHYEIFPPATLANWYGWPSYDPVLGSHHAADHNDGVRVSEKTHDEIAELFQKEFNIPEP